MPDHVGTFGNWPVSRAGVEALATHHLHEFGMECSAEPADPMGCLACYAYALWTKRTNESADRAAVRRLAEEKARVSQAIRGLIERLKDGSSSYADERMARDLASWWDENHHRFPSPAPKPGDVITVEAATRFEVQVMGEWFAVTRDTGSSIIGRLSGWCVRRCNPKPGKARAEWDFLTSDGEWGLWSFAGKRYREFATPQEACEALAEWARQGDH